MKLKHSEQLAFPFVKKDPKPKLSEKQKRLRSLKRHLLVECLTLPAVTSLFLLVGGYTVLTKLEKKFKDVNEKTNEAIKLSNQAEERANQAIVSNSMYSFSTEDRESMRLIVQAIFKKQPSEVDFNIKTALEIYDWFTKNIKYEKGGRRKPPEAVFKTRQGDCDEQAALFAGAIELISKQKTRIIHTFLKDEKNADVGHAYTQVLVGKVWNRELIHTLIETLSKRYELTKQLAASYISSGLDQDETGIWLTFDTTAGAGGAGFRECPLSQCPPYRIDYHDERLYSEKKE